MKKMTNAQYAKALYEAVRDTDKKAESQVVLAFADMLKRHRRLNDVPAIIEAYLAYEKIQSGYTAVVVTSRSTLASKTKKHLAEIYGAKLELTQLIDDTLLGGARIRVGDTVYDATVDTQLKKLQQHLIGQ